MIWLKVNWIIDVTIDSNDSGNHNHIIPFISNTLHGTINKNNNSINHNSNNDQTQEQLKSTAVKEFISSVTKLARCSRFCANINISTNLNVGINTDMNVKNESSKDNNNAISSNNTERWYCSCLNALNGT